MKKTHGGIDHWRAQPRDPETGRWIAVGLVEMKKPERDLSEYIPVSVSEAIGELLPEAGPVMLRLQGMGDPSDMQTKHVYPVRVAAPVSLDEPPRPPEEHGIEPEAPIPMIALLAQPELADPRPRAVVTKFRQTKQRERTFSIAFWVTFFLFLIAMFAILLYVIYRRY